MTLDQKYTRDWYYRNAITAIHEYLKANIFGKRTKDAFVYADCLLSACETDAELAAELIEQKCDRIRYVNHVADKKGKLVGMDVVLSDGDAWKSARKRYYEKRKKVESNDADDTERYTIESFTDPASLTTKFRVSVVDEGGHVVSHDDQTFFSQLDAEIRIEELKGSKK